MSQLQVGLSPLLDSLRATAQQQQQQDQVALPRPREVLLRVMLVSCPKLAPLPAPKPVALAPPPTATTLLAAGMEVMDEVWVVLDLGVTLYDGLGLPITSGG
jgi:hypothetical protein